MFIFAQILIVLSAVYVIFRVIDFAIDGKADKKFFAIFWYIVMEIPPILSIIVFLLFPTDKLICTIVLVITFCYSAALQSIDTLNVLAKKHCGRNVVWTNYILRFLLFIAFTVFCGLIVDSTFLLQGSFPPFLSNLFEEIKKLFHFT